ncbi:MAG: histidine kinase [Gammaproteobacteria bacterium RIFCSPLOWO2_12_47_11]|nr:MAG: histidine kinase [Gammaproteobacteria bacterium RIFCSPLOWO2_12_47_11]
MIKVSELLKNKGHDVWSIGPDASVYDAIKLMADKEVGALIVIEDSKLVGVISERDYARKVILKGQSSKDMQIKEIMTTRVIYTKPEQTVEECMALMTEKHIRHLPIIEGEQLVGIISIGDLVKSIIAEQRFIIEQLGKYISG